jgi:hypothetical protein
LGDHGTQLAKKFEGEYKSLKAQEETPANLDAIRALMARYVKIFSEFLDGNILRRSRNSPDHWGNPLALILPFREMLVWLTLLPEELAGIEAIVEGSREESSKKKENFAGEVSYTEIQIQRLHLSHDDSGLLQQVSARHQ